MRHVHRCRPSARPFLLLSWLLVWAPGSAVADDRVAAHLAALHESIDARAAAALGHIEDLGPRLLAARAYLRSAAHLAERWSWTQAQIDAYQGSPQQAALTAEVDRVRTAFEQANPGYTLFVNPQVRSLDVQLQHWNQNRSVVDAGSHLLEAVRAIVADEEFPAPGTADGRAKFESILKAHQPHPTPALAAPGLSPHGRMHAVDFQVRQGALTVAGPSLELVHSVWIGEGWQERLESAVRQASDRFKGPLQNPVEPWHYDYHP